MTCGILKQITLCAVLIAIRQLSVLAIGQCAVLLYHHVTMQTM